jgi:aldehyde dehydrogenase (NAD+)
MKNFRFDYVFYTGSLSVGKIIYQLAAEKLVPVTLELGGKSPAIVEKDANVTVAARRIALGKYLNVGQTCIAPDYVLVHTDIKEKFINKLKEFIVQFYTDKPSSSRDYGKIINKKRFDILTGYLKNANIIWGGKYDMEALFIEPTVIEGDKDSSSPIFNEEIFGPVLPIFGFETYEEAKNLVERNPNPLAFYLFTSNTKTEEKWINDVSFGGGCINNTAWHFSNHNLPFGGVGNSGIGAYHGKGSFDTFTRVKPVMKTPTWFDPSIKYPPFKGRMKFFKWFFR